DPRDPIEALLRAHPSAGVAARRRSLPGDARRLRVRFRRLSHCSSGRRGAPRAPRPSAGFWKRVTDPSLVYGNHILLCRGHHCSRPRYWSIIAPRDTSEATRRMGTMGRVAVVTGAASGMGLAIAQHFAAAGDRVGLLDFRGEAALRAARDLREKGAVAMAAEADVTDRRAVDAALDKVPTEPGRIQIMVTSAGLDAFERFTDIAIESWERVLAVNLTGTFHCLQAAVPDMLEARWGRMVTISSSSAQSGAPRMAHYVASKGGVI